MNCVERTGFDIQKRCADLTPADDILFNGFYVQPCNVGAEIVGTGPESYGSYFQRGNNYPMGDYKTMTYSPASNIKINTASYAPSTYSNNTFITESPRDLSNNKNLRGEITNTQVARK